VVSPLDLTAAYAVFPNGGYRVRPRGIVSIEDRDGENVHEEHVESDQVLSPQVAFQMLTMLEDVTARGTAAAARSLGVRGEIGGKTGTTNDYRDAWFVGFNSSVVVGVWVGYDQPQKIRDAGSGAHVALPIWADFMRRTAQRVPARPFPVPSGMHATELCHVSYLRPVEECPVYTEYFKDGDDIPTELCPIHKGNLRQTAQRAIQNVFAAIGRGIRGIFK
jgi:penicillin-binding protein 1A